MSLSTKHAQHKKMPLDSTKLLWGARTCLRGAARRYVSSVSEAPTPPFATSEETLMQTSFQTSELCCYLLYSIELHHFQ